MVNCVTVKLFPSTSVSFVKRLPVKGVSSVAFTISSKATGASLTAVTVISKIPVSVALPSDTV